MEVTLTAFSFLYYLLGLLKAGFMEKGVDGANILLHAAIRMMIASPYWQQLRITGVKERTDDDDEIQARKHEV